MQICKVKTLLYRSKGVPRNWHYFIPESILYWSGLEHDIHSRECVVMVSLLVVLNAFLKKELTLLPSTA